MANWTSDRKVAAVPGPRGPFSPARPRPPLRPRRSASGHATALVVIALLASASARAATIGIEAPEAVAPLLDRYLELPEAAPAPEARAALLRRIQEEARTLLATEGYFSPQIEAQVPAPTLDASDQDAPWVIAVTPGPQTLVEAIDIVFTGALADPAQADRRADLRATWTLEPESPFRSADWQAAKDALLAATTDENYPAARIAESRAEVDPERARARLHVVVDSGAFYRFGEVSVVGLKRYPEKRVLRLLGFAPGDPFRREALLQLQAQLQTTPWFSSVSIEADPAEAVDGRVPVRVHVAEARAQRLGLGLGYSTNTGARTEVNYRHHDFFSRGWNFDNTARVEQKSTTVKSALTLPPDGGGYRLGFDVQYDATDIQNLATERHVFGASLTRNRGSIETRTGLQWQREKRSPDAATTQIDRALTLDWRWLRRDVDDPLQPTRGNMVEFRVGGGAQQLLSERDFVRTFLRVQQWWPVDLLGPGNTLSLRGEAGVTVANSRLGIPQEFLFRAGGAQSVRGYAYNSLGVREGEAIVGGRQLLTASAELTHWLSSAWGVAAFVDAGDAADSREELDPAIGAGLGLRWRTVAGPLALDLARGDRTGRWHWHFSLLVAF